ncbi:MAG: prolyl oligopeptidase family serine peptidase [Planctomycetaceae bacterium]|nr:prolyl oligopeptidase family serine peptidase [Planctomycetaceae bacterium]
MKFSLMLTALLLPLRCLHLSLCGADFAYPQAKRSDQKDDYFGTVVADPYRWMEINDTPELTAWINAENQLTRKYLDALPQREMLKKRLTEIVNYPKYTLPWKKAGKLFYFKNDGLQNQSVLYVIDDYQSGGSGNRASAAARVLLDPNKLSADGTVALQNVEVSKDGKYLAYAFARSGSDWNEINVIETAAGKMLNDKIERVKFSDIAWKGDSFYYSCYDAPEGDVLTAKNENHKIFLHKLGTAQKEDILIREDKSHPLRTRQAEMDEEQRYLFLSESESTYGNTLSFLDLSRTEGTFQTIIGNFESNNSVVAVRNNMFYVLTDRKAPNKRLVAVNPAQPQPEHWIDIIPPSDALLQSVSCIGGKFIAVYLKDAAHNVFIHDTAGKVLAGIPLPTLGVAGFSGNQGDNEIFYSFTSFLYPTVIYRSEIPYDLAASGQFKSGETMFPAAVNFQTENYETERIWYTNSAGKKVPLFLSYKKGIKKDGSNPVLLYGYGGFNISISPSFNPYRLPFLEKGGIYAQAVLRGGGEYGEEWHQAGTKRQKQNVFDDFAAAAEFLIKEKYTSPEKLAIQGGSNGGLLVGASAVQRPDLFKAAVAQVGVLDMLRYHKFTIGWSWATDYGTSEESKEMFKYLYKYSPLHNIKSGVNYPAMLITTSDHDDRVVPAHSFKFTAEMQAKTGGKNPVYIRIETKAGHGAGKPVSKRIDEAADIWAFLMEQLGMQ